MGTSDLIAVRFPSLSFFFFRSFSFFFLTNSGARHSLAARGPGRLQETYGVVPNSGLSTPKEDVYKDYAQMCARDGKSAMARATFGKILHVAFPGITCNRLGRRGTHTTLRSSPLTSALAQPMANVVGGLGDGVITQSLTRA